MEKVSARCATSPLRIQGPVRANTLCALGAFQRCTEPGYTSVPCAELKILLVHCKMGCIGSKEMNLVAEIETKEFVALVEDIKH